MIQTNERVVLPSGRALEFQDPGWALSCKLKCLVFQLARQTNIGDMNLGDALKGGGLSMEKVEVNDLKNVFCTLLGSEELDKLLLACMKGGSLLNGVRITDQTFEDVILREDFIPCQKEVGWRTLSPFFKSLGSLLSALGIQTTTPSPT